MAALLAGGRPDVSVLVPVGDDDRDRLPEVMVDVAAQPGVRAEVIFVDRTLGGGLSAEGATVLHAPDPSPGIALLEAAALASAPILALHHPGARMAPGRLAAAVEHLTSSPSLDAVVGSLAIEPPGSGDPTISSPTGWGDEPPPLWLATFTARRDALSHLSRASWHPACLEQYQRLRSAGRLGCLDQVATTVRHEDVEERADTARLDAALLSLDTWEADTPRVSVILATHQRLPVLLRCLESFCRQLVPLGAHEIIVVDDGSTDGTREWMERVHPRVPLRYVWREHGGASRARNHGLSVARGALSLWVNDDTIATPDLVARHLAAHRRLSPHPAMVLGTFEQPPHAMRNGLVRHLDSSTEVFLYSAMKPGAAIGGGQLYTCNASIPTSAVRALGGFDEGFPRCLGEDTDMGLRLEGAGYQLHYRPECRALHDHLLDLDDLAARQRFVGETFVALFQKHPGTLLQWAEVATLTIEDLRGDLDRAAPGGPVLEEMTRSLSRLDLSAIEDGGGRCGELVGALQDQLAQGVKALNGTWWREGYLEGLRAHGLSGFPELLARAPYPLAAPEGVGVTVMLPGGDRWRIALHAWCHNFAGDQTRALLVAARSGGEAREVTEAAARARAMGHDLPAPRVVVVLLPDLPGADYRLLGAGDAWLPCGAPNEEQTWELAIRLGLRAETVEPPPGRAPPGPEPGFLELLAVPRLYLDAESLARPLGGLEEPPAPAGDLSALLAANRPILSVVVPTCDRGEALAGLIRHLLLQDLPPHLFELLVVDDGSETPASLPADLPFQARLLRQPQGGPGLARNRALAEARGTWVVFFNDDATPAPDNLRRHLVAQLYGESPAAVLGSFDLPAALQDTPVRRLLARTNLLFAQSAMDAGREYPGMTLCTGNLSVPLAHVRAVGGFDPFFRFAGGEDSDLGIRLERRMGVRVRYDPEIRCGHDHRLDLSSLLRRQHVLGWCAWHLATKHGDPSILVGGDAGEPGDAFYTALLERVESLNRRADERKRLVESAERGDDVPDDALEESVRTLGYQVFAWGLLRAENGLMPLSRGSAEREYQDA